MDASIVDKDLIERINKGEEKAFEVLYNSYFVYLCACANSYIFNPVEAQDIVNETFAKGNYILIYTNYVKTLHYICILCKKLLY